MIPATLQPQQLVHVVGALVEDGYGDPHLEFDPDLSAEITRTTITGWLQQTARFERDTAEADRDIGTWLLVTNAAGITARDRIEWGDLTFAVDGPPAPVHTPTGLHHYELTLRLVEG